MVRRSDGKAAQMRRIGVASTIVVAAVFAPAFEHRAEPAPLRSVTQAAGPAVRLALPPAAKAPPALPSPKLTSVARPVAPAPQVAIASPAAAIATVPEPLQLVSPSPAPVAETRAIQASEVSVLPAPSAPSPAEQPALAIDAMAVEPAPGLTHETTDFAAIAVPLDDRLVYIPQVSETVRAAYIAQVDAATPGQRLAVRSGDEVIGAVQFQVSDGVVSVNVGQVLDLFEGKFDGARFAELRSSPATQAFVSLDELQGAGIPLEYNAAYDELTLDLG